MMLGAAKHGFVSGLWNCLFGGIFDDREVGVFDNGISVRVQSKDSNPLRSRLCRLRRTLRMCWPSAPDQKCDSQE